MSYTKTNWVDGDLITATKLNKLEQGVLDAAESGGIMIVGQNENAMRLDKTAGEIMNAVTNKIPVYVIFYEDDGIMYADNSRSINRIYIGELMLSEVNYNTFVNNETYTDFYFVFQDRNTSIAFVASTASDYPEYYNGSQNDYYNIAQQT